MSPENSLDISKVIILKITSRYKCFSINNVLNINTSSTQYFPHRCFKFLSPTDKTTTQRPCSSETKDTEECKVLKE